MRLDEITKAEFVDKMTDPAMAELKAVSKQIKKELNLDGVMYSLKTYDQPDRGTRRKAVVTWDLRYIHDENLVRFARIDHKIAAHYTEQLEHWGIKGWESQSNVIEYELMEGGW